MKEGNTQGTKSEEQAIALWRQHVWAMPSTFARLVFLAGLRNPATGRYSHPQLNSLLAAEAADRAICETHREAFSEWLSLNLESQQLDLNLFLSGVEGYRRQILAACAIAAPHMWCIPEGVAEHERQLYLADLAAILEPLYAEYGVCADADSKPAAPLSGGLVEEPRRR